MRCLACHYPLKGIRGPEHRCPECGRAFDPRNPQSFVSPRGASGLRTLLALSAATFIGAIGVVLIITKMLPQFATLSGYELFIVPAIATFVTFPIYVLMSFDSHSRPKDQSDE